MSIRVRRAFIAIAVVVGVVRFADGTLNVDRVAEHWRKSAPVPAQPQQPMSERTRRMIENARIRQARIAEGRIHFVDRAAGDLHHPSLGIPNLGDAAKVLARGAVGAFIPGRPQAKVPSQPQLEDEAVNRLKGLLHR